MTFMNRKLLLLVSALMPLALNAQQTLTLDDCRKMAVDNNRTLIQNSIEIEMAGYDKAIARANYFPQISAKGMYLYNDREIDLIGDEMSSVLRNGGTLVQEQLGGAVAQLTQAILSNPSAAVEYMTSPMWQTVLGTLSKADLSGMINGIGTHVDDALHLNIQNVYVGAVSVTQPVFVGGKILAANKIATLAERLAEERYDTEYQKIIVTVDQAYWQIVSIAAKKKLAESLVELLETMTRDAELSVREGVATESDLLSVKVKANEAKTMLLKASNGLSLAKMLLCQEIGLPLDSEIVLADEGDEDVPMPGEIQEKSMDEILSDRSEIRSLDIASKIYDNKVKVARADLLPTIGLTANYLVTNPNLNDGFANKFGGRFSGGVVVGVPLFHGFEAVSKMRKAEAESRLYKSKKAEAEEMIALEVAKITHERREALENLETSRNNLESAEENLRKSMIGFEEGVIEASVALAAQTAWMQAHSEYVDAGIALRMTSVDLDRAYGNIKAYER